MRVLPYAELCDNKYLSWESVESISFYANKNNMKLFTIRVTAGDGPTMNAAAEYLLANCRHRLDKAQLDKIDEIVKTVAFKDKDVIRRFYRDFVAKLLLVNGLNNIHCLVTMKEH